MIAAALAVALMLASIVGALAYRRLDALNAQTFTAVCQEIASNTDEAVRLRQLEARVADLDAQLDRSHRVLASVSSALAHLNVREIQLASTLDGVVEQLDDDREGIAMQLQRLAVLTTGSVAALFPPRTVAAVVSDDLSEAECLRLLDAIDDDCIKH